MTDRNQHVGRADRDAPEVGARSLSEVGFRFRVVDDLGQEWAGMEFNPTQYLLSREMRSHPSLERLVELLDECVMVSRSAAG